MSDRRRLAYQFQERHIEAPASHGNARLMPATIKSGRAASLRRGVSHMVEAAAIATDERGAVLVARWECGGSSINAIAIDDAHDAAATCHRCGWASQLERGPVVYRCIADDGEVVYIGSTINLRQRVGAHRSGTAWWDEVVEVRSESHPTEAAARIAEAAAIQCEQPFYNRDGVRQAASP